MLIISVAMFELPSEEVIEVAMRYMLFMFIFFVVGCSAFHETPSPFGDVKSQVQASPEVIAKGAKVFKYRCSACHSMDPNKSQFFGPHLAGLLGRKIATVEGYMFTEEVQQLDIVWTEPVLNEWLTKPQQMVPDMCMPFLGLPKADDRHALIEYMKTP
ncbi:c-type cytochrome [Pseudidiomarina woesei]|uniref:Cytochrome c2 n=1 Tax=Pseudidiomarina woesei TaxID=1381080 RepID=A0A0K6H4A7_9GAMM|nr:c-type cytochrome [Pseudidiomarina woesei]CUA85824.1 Cytochrome c2 [Pseudidiomarina woesei]